MNGNIVTYKEVKREVFDEVANLCTFNKETRNPFAALVTVEYNGNQFFGEMRISVSAGEIEVYKEMLQKVAEILAKY